MHTGSTARRARQLFEALVGRRSGILREVVIVPRRAPHEPALFHVGGQVADPRSGSGERAGLHVGGSGATLDLALIAALAEGVERYCAAAFDIRAFPLRTRDEALQECPAGADVVKLDLVAAFSPTQYRTPGFPFPRPTAQSALRWCVGVDLDSGDEVWAPALTVAMPVGLARGEEVELCPSTSTGLCCASTYADAALGALCEVIERDALALTWLKRATPPRISEASYRNLAELPRGDDVRVYELTTELAIPVYLVVGRGLEREGPLLYTGSACHLRPERALQKAIKEANQGRVYVRHLTERRLGAKKNETPQSFVHHAQFYTAHPELVEEAFRFCEGGPTVELALDDHCESSTPELLEQLSERLATNHIRPRIFELSQPWCRKLDLRVVRAVMPELLGLHGHHLLPSLGHPRLRATEQCLPLATTTLLAEGEVSAFPHPFA